MSQDGFGDGYHLWLVPVWMLIASTCVGNGVGQQVGAEAMPSSVGLGRVDMTPDHPIRIHGFGFGRAAGGSCFGCGLAAFSVADG